MPNPPSHPNAATAAFQDPVSGAGSNTPLGPNDLAFLDPPTVEGDLGSLGKYRVVRLLGQGGMGFVFAAQDNHLRRDIALKVMKPELAIDIQFRERFLQEARAAAQVQSEYVVTVFDFGVHGDAPFIAMQLLHGEALQDRLQREGPLPLDMAIAVLRQSAEGLAAAHRLGMTHRDIKPANLWLEADPASGAFRRVKILDFGLARLEDRDTKLTASGMIVGTPHYMAPEQASGLQVDARADLFSLGCVAYTTLTGRLAFEGTSTMAVLMSLANHTPTPLCVANLNVPSELSDLVGRMMAKNRDLRIASADEIVAALDRMRPEPPPPPLAAPAQTEGGFFGRARPSDAVKTVPSRASQATPAPWPAQTPRPGPGPSGPFTLTAATMPSRMAIPIPQAAPPKKSGDGWLKYALGGIVLACLAGGAFVFLGGNKSTSSTDTDKTANLTQKGGGSGLTIPVTLTGNMKVGVLHASSGDTASEEKPVAAATELAIKEVGKVLGQPLEPIVPDGLSDPASFAQAAERLISENRVAALFGCGTPASRSAVAKVAARHKVPLFYPVRSEGMESDSSWVVSLGPVPNQSILPAVDFLVHRRNKRKFFHVGSDDSYSRRANSYITAYLEKQKLATGSPRLVGSAYLTADGQNADKIIADIQAAKPDMVVSSISGRASPFLDKLAAGLTGMTVSVLSFDLSEADRQALAASGRNTEQLVAGVNFPRLAGGPLDPLQAKFSILQTASDPMAAAYTGVKLWAKAVEQAKSDDRTLMMDKLGQVIEQGLAGYVKIDAATRHAYLPCRVGMIEPGGAVRIIYEVNRDDGIKPIPDLYTKPDAVWNEFLNGLIRSK